MSPYWELCVRLNLSSAWHAMAPFSEGRTGTMAVIVPLIGVLLHPILKLYNVSKDILTLVQTN